MIQDTITAILKREGWDKYTNLPADRGGPTKWGITEKAWGGDVRNITESEARVFYLNEYVNNPKFHLINDENLRHLTIDCGVNHGTRRAARWLQKAANVKADGVLGPISLKAVDNADPLELFLWLIAYRIKLYGRLVSKDRTQAVFAAGWNNRAASFLEAAATRLERDHARSH